MVGWRADAVKRSGVRSQVSGAGLGTDNLAPETEILHSNIFLAEFSVTMFDSFDLEFDCFIPATVWHLASRFAVGHALRPGKKTKRERR